MLRPLLAVTLVALGACSEPDPPRQHVVLVLVDQLRADVTEAWMPKTRALAQDGVVLSHMRAAAPWTYPSVTSLLSGLYPQQHGADASPDGKELSRISPEVPLLPRTLRAAGYHTAAFVTNPFLHDWNVPFQSAFDHCDDSFIGDQGARRGHPELVWTERMYANTVNAHVREYFDARPLAGPEFTYVHYIDVHGRKEGDSRWQDAPFLPGYENAVRYVDERIAELHAYFHARYGGALVFVVTSDHGQNLGDDLALGEGQPWRQKKASLHDFNLRIPFFVLPGDSVPRGLVLDEGCSNIDVTPTLLAWLGVPGHADVPGVSLLGLLHGEPAAATRPLYARHSTDHRLEEALLVGERKLVRYEKVAGKPVERSCCFDLAADPREAVDLGCSAAELEELLRVAGAAGRIYPATFAAPDEGTRATLDDLGYGGESSAEEEHK
ncbi:MAG: sulfatase [Planctomycetota bacterium]